MTKTIKWLSSLVKVYLYVKSSRNFIAPRSPTPPPWILLLEWVNKMSVIVCLYFLLYIPIFMEISAFLKESMAFIQNPLIKNVSQIFKGKYTEQDTPVCANWSEFLHIPKSTRYIIHLTFSMNASEMRNSKVSCSDFLSCARAGTTSVCFDFKPRVLSSFIGETLVCCPPHRADRVFASFLRGPCQGFIRRPCKTESVAG